MPAKRFVNGWWRPWWPLAVTVIVLLATGWAGYVRTQAKCSANERRIDRIELKMDKVVEDVAFTRGLLTREFGEQTD